MQDRRTKLGYALLGAMVMFMFHPWVSPAAAEDPAVKKKMARWKTELGVKCDHCHVLKEKKYDYEAETARKKIADYCEENFVKKLELPGGKKIGCVDCHQRKARFLPRPKGELPDVAEGGDKDEGEEKDEKKKE